MRKVGRPRTNKFHKQTNMEMVKKVAELRLKGLTFREIAKELNKPVCSVYRWFKYSKR